MSNKEHETTKWWAAAFKEQQDGLAYELVEHLNKHCKGVERAEVIREVIHPDISNEIGCVVYVVSEGWVSTVLSIGGFIQGWRLAKGLDQEQEPELSSPEEVFSCFSDEELAEMLYETNDGSFKGTALEYKTARLLEMENPDDPMGTIAEQR